MSNEIRFTPGEAVVLRRVWEDRLYRVTTARVVQDSPERIVLYWGPGYPLKVKRSLLLHPFVEKGEWRETVWGVSHLLMLIRPGDAHAVYAMWGDDWSLRGWYINLQAPLRRTPLGFDTTDYLLDITVNPDRTEWAWKDEADFKAAAAAGRFSAEQARAIRAEGERAIRLVQEGPASHYEAWAGWRPPADWTVPAMPPGSG